MTASMASGAKSVEPIAVTAACINSDLGQTIWDLQSIVVELQGSAVFEHAPNGRAFANRTIALQSAAVALQKHAMHLKDMIDPVRSVLRPERFYQAGVVASADERFEIAAGFFRRALELRAEYREAHKGLGDVLRKQGAHEEAIKHSRRAAEIQANLAHALETQGKLAEAVEGYCTAGVEFTELGDYDEAANTLRKAIKLDTRNAKAHADLGGVLHRKHEDGAAEMAFRTAIHLDSTCAEAHGTLAMLLIQQNRHDEALSLLSTSAAIKHDHGNKLGGAIKMPVYRIKHDREQITLLRQRGLLEKKWEPYAEYLNALWTNLQTQADTVAPVEITGANVQTIAPSINRFVYFRHSPAIPGRALRRDLNVEELQRDYSHSRPEIVWMDDFLTQEALFSLRQFCIESTVWKAQFAGGYLGALLKSGFSSPLILQIAEEIRTRLPVIFGCHRLEQAWAFKYDSTMKGTNVHADFAAVNVNFWITPNEACRDLDNSGLIIWDKGSPPDWRFREYNNAASENQIRRFLADAGARSVRVPYRSNRCVIFNSALFHETDRFAFADAYEHRRINVTFLYGIGLPTR
jgi:tetratricopeptide (TPR) repeat protein